MEVILPFILLSEAMAESAKAVVEALSVSQVMAAISELVDKEVAVVSPKSIIIVPSEIQSN